MYIHMRSSSGLFHVRINAKSVNQFPVSVYLLRLVLGRNVDDAVVKLQPATLSPTGAVAPNEGCITDFFVSYDGGGIKYVDTIGLSILFCLQQNKNISKAYKEAKTKLEYRSSESNFGRRVRVRYRSLTPLQKF